MDNISRSTEVSQAEAKLGFSGPINLRTFVLFSTKRSSGDRLFLHEANHHVTWEGDGLPTRISIVGLGHNTIITSWHERICEIDRISPI